MRGLYPTRTGWAAVISIGAAAVRMAAELVLEHVDVSELVVIHKNGDKRAVGCGGRGGRVPYDFACGLGQLGWTVGFWRIGKKSDLA